MSASATKLRLDRSRPFATVHGERPPADRHQYAHFQQDGIHYDAHGLHIEDLIDDEKTRALVERRLKRQAKLAPKEDTADAGDGDDDDIIDPAPEKGAGSDSADVNLEAWLRGEVNYHWFAVTKALRDRYHQNMSGKFAVVEFLVEDEKVVPFEELAPDFKTLLRPKAA